jgi:glycosyltransferase involved in cell wall biosynthesis
LKVLIFMTQFCYLGGAERLGVELAEKLNKRGIHTDILSMYTDNLPGVVEAKEVLLNKGIPSVHFLNMHLHPPMVSIIPAILKLRRLIFEQAYDIVETSFGSTTILASWAIMGTRVRNVSGLHDIFTKERSNKMSHKFWRFTVRFNRRIRFYAISNSVKSHWINYSNTKPDYTRTIYNGIPDDCYNAVPERKGVRTELKIPYDSKIALFVGRMLKRKGIDTLLDALCPILHSTDLFLIYVGGWDHLDEEIFLDEAGLFARMREQIARAGLDERVLFLGHRYDVPRLMASSDILIHPARIEGFGLVLAEAMAAGLPVVASNVGGIPEVLEGTDSLIVPPEDPLALRTAVLEVLNRNPEEAERAARQGRSCAERYRIDLRVNKIIKLFKDVLQDS